MSGPLSDSAEFYNALTMVATGTERQKLDNYQAVMDMVRAQDAEIARMRPVVEAAVAECQARRGLPAHDDDETYDRYTGDPR